MFFNNFTLFTASSRENIYRPLDISLSKKASFGYDGVVYVNFTDDYHANTEIGSAYVYDVNDSEKNYDGVPSDILTVTRSSTATYCNSTGYIATANTNELRYDYDPITNLLEGVIVEGSSTNMFLRSIQFANNSVWSKSGSTATENATVAPDGSNTASKFVSSNTSGAGYMNQSVTFVSGTTYCFSLFVKKAEVDEIRLLLPAAAFTSAVNISFDFTDEAITTSTAGSGTITATGFEKYRNGWYRIWFSSPATASGSYAPQIRQTVNGNSSDGVYVWGAQLETGPRPTSYIGTTTATVTRSSDSIIIGAGVFPVGEECTLYTQGELRRKQSLGGTAQLIRAYSGSDVIDIREGTIIGGSDARIVDTAVVQADTSSVSITDGDIYSLAVSAKTDDLKFYANGVSIGTDSSLTIPVIDKITILPNNGSVYIVKKFAYITKALSADELTILTTA